MEYQYQKESSPTQQRVLKWLKFAAYLAVFADIMWIMHGPLKDKSASFADKLPG